MKNIKRIKNKLKEIICIYKIKRTKFELLPYDKKFDYLSLFAIKGLNTLKKDDVVYSGYKKMVILDEINLSNLKQYYVNIKLYFKEENEQNFKKKNFNSKLFLSDYNVINGGYNPYQIFYNKKISDYFYELTKDKYIKTNKLDNPEETELIFDKVAFGPKV